MDSTQKSKLTPKDFFFEVGILASLYVSAVSFIFLAFEVINRLIPDALDTYYYGSDGGARIALSSLIVAFPLFLWLSMTLHKAFASEPSRKELTLRKWFIYLTLFIAGLVVSIDVITVINYFLNGEATTRFFVKALVVLVLAIVVFVYEKGELKSDGFSKSALLGFRYGSSSAVLILVVGSLFIFGGPASKRIERLDSTRVSDLSQIQYQITDFWQNKNRLPATLDELKDPLMQVTLPKDPTTGALYEYTKVASTTFELCATFEGISTKPQYAYPVPEENFVHEVGRTCFARTIDPERYPPRVPAVIKQ